MIETGQPAPDFELPDQDGEPVKLSDLRGKRVVLYFYPKADASGQTTSYTLAGGARQTDVCAVLAS
jgi:peroxiredoxin